MSWEFKWKSEDVELHGPHTSQKMLDWQVETLINSLTLIFILSLLTIQCSSHFCSLFPQESGFFDAGILVRKVGTEEFRDSKRIDFELYV